MEAFIKAVSTYLPKGILTNEMLVQEFPEWTVDKIADKVGIKQRHIAASDEFVSDMATHAANKLFAEHSIDRNIIDYVLLCTQSPDYFLPTTACLVQHQLGLRVNIGAIDINQGCSGYVYGLSLAKGLILGNIAKNVLLITSETYSKFIHKDDKGNRTIFGDAATATLISSQGVLKIQNFELGSNGEGASNLIVKNGAARNPTKTCTTRNDDFGNLISDDHLYMNGGEIFNFTLRAVPSLIDNTLKNNSSTLDDIDFFIFHQANKYMLNHLRKKIGIPEEKFLINMKNYGNTVSSTIPIVLESFLSKTNFSINNKLLLAGFGVGYSWGGVLLNIEENRAYI